MFEEPKKELQTLEDELQTLTHKDEDFEEFYAQIFEEFGDKSMREDEFAPEEPAAPQQVVTAAPAYTDRQSEPAPVKKEKSIALLTVLIVLELLGIAGVAAFWLLRLL